MNKPRRFPFRANSAILRFRSVFFAFEATRTYPSASRPDFYRTVNTFPETLTLRASNAFVL